MTCRSRRDLVIGLGLGFVDRGAHELKGVPGEWRLVGLIPRRTWV
jgi:hypothetical protein